MFGGAHPRMSYYMSVTCDASACVHERRKSRLSRDSRVAAIDSMRERDRGGDWSQLPGMCGRTTYREGEKPREDGTVTESSEEDRHNDTAWVRVQHPSNIPVSGISSCKKNVT